ncbi:MAG: Fe-S protein assembly co-chaperone HscB [Pseudomonadota bacterium]|nr:Fe-S protein assembly co-chaperone HscB [Pseudomonadota bacterium]
METQEICWNCKHHLQIKNFFCDNCEKIQSPWDINEFELLGLERKYKIDLDDLENKYLRLQQLFHPDKFLNFSEKEKKYSTIFSSKINDAYQKIINNSTRANILFKALGYEIDLEKKSYDDPEVLEEIMEIQNKCLSIDKKESKRKILKDLDQRIEETTEQLSKSFDDKNYPKAKKLNIKLSYLEKIRKNLKLNNEFN